MKKLVLKPGQLSLADLRAVAREKVFVSLDKSAYKNIDAAKKVVDDIVADGRTVGTIDRVGVLSVVATEDL